MRKNANSYDYLRVLAAYAVILLHTAAPLLYLYNEIPFENWMIGNIFDSLVRWCVPVFIMLSGAFLLDPSRNETIHSFLQRRMDKILIPFLAWSLIYYFYYAINYNREISVESLIRNILNNEITNHLWYIYILIGLYLITPVIRIFIKYSNKSILLYFLTLWFIGNSVFNLIDHLFNLNIYFDFVIDDYLGYYLLGYFLRTERLNKKTTLTIYASALICIFITIFGTYFDTVNNGGNIVGFYYNYLSPNTVIISVAIFLLFRNLNTSATKLKSLIYFISQRSFGIYLIHILIQRILSEVFNFNHFSFHPLISIPLVSIVIFALSCISVFVLQKIPFIKKIVP